ncbi:exodeoxyribonuclease V subunit alpha [Castellaniella sp.]|uniref:exodeoxyribonuclease V subunit alpha n=1 Tax=Castellaniella sp. TaxID=1955812 RepID=UPI00355D3FFB
MSTVFSAAARSSDIDGGPAWLRFSAASVLGPLDIALGRFLHGHDPQAPELALQLACLCSARLGQGHPGLDLAALFQRTMPERPEWLAGTLADGLQALEQARFVGDGSGAEPLILAGTHLYLARYWHAARRIRTWIQHHLAMPLPPLPDTAQIRALFDMLFGPVGDSKAAPDWQRLACATALLHRFSIITGGPGTGKTTTVVRLLALLLALDGATAQGSRLRIRLAAPTGKAAARLTESMASVLAHWHDQPALAILHESMPEKAHTLHRLLGMRFDHVRPYHHAGNPLDLDVLVVDEASMLDIELMDAMLAALPDSARLVLLGDKDQLASVEAGAILGELCRRAERGHYRPGHAERLRTLCGEAPGQRWLDADGTALDQAIVMLRHSHRFRADSGIGRLARIVHDEDLPALRALIQTPLADLRWILPRSRRAEGPADHSMPATDDYSTLAPRGHSTPATHGQSASATDWLLAAGVLSAQGYPALFARVHDGPGAEAPAMQRDAWAAEILHQQAQFQVLCALRQGAWGIEGLNQLLEARLRQLGCIGQIAGAWYAGRPVLVLRNQPALGLANGDMGVALPIADPRQPLQPRLRVAFPSSVPGELRWISPARLAHVETAYALTVHKSQGSEFDRVVLVLPERPGPVLTRELLYTGLTRARTHLCIVSPGGTTVIEQALHNPVRREGGLFQMD